MTAALPALTPEMKPFRPYGAAVEALRCHDPEVLLDGPAGTGKSLAWLNKMLILCDKYPGSRHAMIRKTRKSLTETALWTWEEEVLPPHHPMRSPAKREQRASYHHPNGSTVVVAGLDDPQKIMSSQFDFIYIQEATECEEEEVDMVTTRLRNGKMPYQQLAMDCNPGPPRHWLKRRFEREQTTRFASVHKDNPRWWDHEKEAWTPEGERYLATLMNLPPMLRKRLFEGVWAAAEGAIYDCFDTEEDVIEPFPLPPEWPRYVGLDFGGTNTAALFTAVDPDTDILYHYREYLAGGRTAGSHVAWLTHNEPHLIAVGGARSEEQWRREFTSAGLPVLEPRISDVTLGIMRVYGQHKRHGIKVFNTLTGYLEEKAEYRYKLDAANPDQIEDKHRFHAMDAERYLVGWLRPERETWVPSAVGRKGLASAVER